jgi:hypothetical protein
MAIVATDLLLRLSGGACNSDPDCALGGVMSTTTAICPTASEENLFNNVDGAEACSGSVKFRGLFFLNSNGSLTLSNSVAWLPSNTPSCCTIVEFALDLAGLNMDMDTIANEDTVPCPTLCYVSPATKGAGLSTGAVPTLGRFGAFYRRTVTACAGAQNNDDWSIEWEGDTPA